MTVFSKLHMGEANESLSIKKSREGRKVWENVHVFAPILSWHFAVFRREMRNYFRTWKHVKCTVTWANFFSGKIALHKSVCKVEPLQIKPQHAFLHIYKSALHGLKNEIYFFPCTFSLQSVMKFEIGRVQYPILIKEIEIITDFSFPL